MTGRVWRCFCGVDVIGGALQEHLIQHARRDALDAGEDFLWFDEEYGCCAHCGAGIPRTDRGRAHLYVCHRRPGRSDVL